MAAIITSEFRKNARAIFTNELKNGSDDYFIGLGKTDSWPDTTDSLNNVVTEYSRQFSAPLPVDTVLDKIDVLQNLMVLAKVSGTTDNSQIFNVIPRNNWAFDRIYKTYDPTDPKCFDYETIDGVAYYPCYVTSNDRIYFCLSNTDGNGEVTPSSVAIPSGTGNEGYLSFEGNPPQAISNGEGYIWTLVSTLDEDSKFYTDQFVDYTQPTALKYDNILSATGGLVYDFKIVNGGSNATTVPQPDSTVITIKGTERNGSGDLVPAPDVVIYNQNQNTSGTAVGDFDVVFNNGIESIKYKPDANVVPWKLGYVTASIVVQTGGGEVNEEVQILPLLLPEEGLGRFPDRDLPSFYAGIAVDFIGEVDGEAPVGYNVDVRQISLIKNPTRNVTGDNEGVAVRDNPLNQGQYTGDEAYDGLKYLQLTDQPDLTQDYIGRDFIIEQPGGINEDVGARAWLDYADSANNRLYYHQNSSSKVNFKKFQKDVTSTPITVTSIAGYSDGIEYQVTDCGEAEYMSGTGEVIFYENRKPINRNFNQTDEVKLVIQF